MLPPKENTLKANMLLAILVFLKKVIKSSCFAPAYSWE